MLEDSIPTLGMIAKAYCNEVCIAIVHNCLLDLAEYAGVENKMTQRQMYACAEVIATNEQYRHLKISELLLFFHKYKSGEYGRFYGNVDPMAITEALGRFCDWRVQELGRIERDNNVARFNQQALATELQTRGQISHICTLTYRTHMEVKGAWRELHGWLKSLPYIKRFGSCFQSLGWFAMYGEVWAQDELEQLQHKHRVK